ncbi:MAG: alkaline phosphatase family protein [Acidobacteria bacterium]|nr:alkaline phosphatase family protein [Acidobacteriota bacterium]
MNRKNLLISAVTCFLLLSASTAAAVPAAASAPDGDISLVLVIAVDQMRADYLTRFQHQYTRGIRQLLARGRAYTNAHQEHACTQTAVGHSTILTGVFPSRSGIIGNEWYDRSRKQVVYCTRASGYGDDGGDQNTPTPLAQRATTLGDWLIQSRPGAKVLAISRKDRAAIMLGGHKATGAFWYDPSSGTFTTSSYYHDELPGWVRLFNAQKPADKYFRKVWERSRRASDYAASSADDQKGEGKLSGRQTFPYRYGGGARPDRRFYSYLSNTPFMDEITLGLAERAIKAENLGRRGVVDLLAVSLSTTDSIGHTFGPQSQEIQDMMFRLDRMLGDFFRYVDRNVGLEKVLVVLTSDHGVAPLPEAANADGVTIRQAGGVEEALREAEAALEGRFGPGPWIEREYDGNVYLNREKMQNAGVSTYEVELRAAEALRRAPIVEDAFTRSDLTSGRRESEPYVRLFANCFDPARSGDIVLQTRADTLLMRSAEGSTHGSPYPFDTHVPLIVAGPGVAPGTVGARVRTVDIAPTLAGLLGIVPPGPIDGRLLPTH